MPGHCHLQQVGKVIREAIYAAGGVPFEFNTIGVDDSGIGRGNFIAFNGGDGVGVDTPTAYGNAISKNFIFLNDGLGIHLTNGANNDMEPPEISSAPNSGPGMITGTAVAGSTVG